MEKTTRNVKGWELQKKGELEKMLADYEYSLVEKDYEIAIRYPNLKEDVLKMIDIINPDDYGLLKAMQEAIIEAQAEYYYNDSMQFEEIRRKVLNY